MKQIPPFDPVKKRWVPISAVRSYEQLPKTNKLIKEFFINGHRKGRKFSNNTTKVYEVPLDFFFQNKKEYDEIGKEDIMEFVMGIREMNARDTTQRNYFDGVRSFFRYLYDSERIPKNPFHKVKFNIEDNWAYEVEKQIFTRDEIMKIMQATAKHPLYNAIFALLYGHGMRISEVFGLKIDDIDFERNTISIYGKGRKRRKNYMKPCVSDRLRLWLMIRGQMKHDYVFVTKFGNPFNSHSLRNRLVEIIKDAGITKKITPHSFRHTHITHAIEDGVQLPEVQKAVGHSSITTTMRYCQVAQTKPQYLEKFRNF